MPDQDVEEGFQEAVGMNQKVRMNVLFELLFILYFTRNAQWLGPHNLML